MSCLFANGNVTKIGDTMLEYDSVVKDKLVKVGGKVVAYDANNPLVPTSYDGNTYTFEGRRLARIQKGGKVIDYTYNDQGLRIKKTITENGTSLETRFFYDGAKLITEITPEHRLDFLYDENDRLYGFVLDKTAMYFYVRDTLENILGIIDKNGNLVVQYAYNAWGKPESTTGTLATTIGEYNPFRYKGYHFDSDTGMYYCRTRYYVPDWCRWLCGDDFYFIKTDDLKSTNLFAYCQNDPINKQDESGCFAWLIAIILIGCTVAGATLGGLKANKDAKDAGKSRKEVIIDTIKGVFIGASFGLAAGGAIVATGAVFAGAFGATSIFGMSIVKAFAVGALAFNFNAFVVAPLMGVTMNGFEIGTPSDPTPKPGEGPVHPGYRK